MLHEIKFKSSNGRDDVYGWIYVPADVPKGIFHLVHGFGEHSRRYLHMIVNLLEAGYIVAANDHVGHGKTAVENDTWGDWGDNGYATMREDEYLFKSEVQKLYKDIPYYMYGHSMGSMIARDFIAHYGDELDGAIICGTISGNAFPISQVKEAMLKAVEAGRGDEYDTEFLPMLMGGLYSRVGEVKLGNEWICHDENVQKDHALDPFNAFTKPTKIKSALYFVEMMEVILGTEWAQKVPTNLPIFNIGGDEDPVGNYGEGIYECSNYLLDTGHNVTTKVYSGYRHEIHNYKDLKDVVLWDIIEFLDNLKSE